MTLKMPTEVQCRQMVDGLLHTMKTTPLASERDRLSAQELIGRVEALIRDNRLFGVSDCATWAAMSRLVVHQ